MRNVISDVARFIVAPRDQGQIVERSWGCTEDYIIARIHDRFDGAIRYEVYEWPDDDADFEPWNDVPSVGELVWEGGDALSRAAITR